MLFLYRRRFAHLRQQPFCHIRTLYDAVSAIKCPRDRGLDHAVARERHLKPLLSLKDLILSEPSKSVPLSVITDSKEALGIPFRPIEFIRKYSSVFQEFHPGSLNFQPHIKLTPEIISLSSEENLLHQSVDYKQNVAARLLKLLMISRISKIPIFLLDQLKWELGLPQDYEKVIIPEFPDYFRVIHGTNLRGDGKALELVCWTDEFAISEMEKKGSKDGKIQFCLQYSTGFEMDKKYKKWVDEWQKLPYVSPYMNAVHLPSKTDESDKWAVSVLHEVLSLFVGKKAERDILLSVGEYLGLRARFKRAFLQHPGIFYVSNKIGNHMVVLRDAYKRGVLIERQPLMDMRFKYVKLMNVAKDEEKTRSVKQKNRTDVKEGEGEELVDGDDAEDDDEMYDSSGYSQNNDDDDDDDDDDEEEEEEEEEEQEKEERATKRRRSRTSSFQEKSSRRNVAKKPNGSSTKDDMYKNSRFSRRNLRVDPTVPRRSPQKYDGSRNNIRPKTEKSFT